MKTLLYEIRYYLAATVLVLLLVPDHEKATLTQETHETVKPISTIRKNQVKYPVYSRVGLDRELDIEFQILLEEEMKKNNKDPEKHIDDLFPKPNRY